MGGGGGRGTVITVRFEKSSRRVKTVEHVRREKRDYQRAVLPDYYVSVHSKRSKNCCI
jgi:hypothetical protein